MRRKDTERILQIFVGSKEKYTKLYDLWGIRAVSSSIKNQNKNDKLLGQDNLWKKQ